MGDGGLQFCKPPFVACNFNLHLGECDEGVSGFACFITAKTYSDLKGGLAE